MSLELSRNAREFWTQNKFLYIPLEPYPERYTIQLSAPKGGWIERQLIKKGICYVRIDGEKLGKDIKTGEVLDACGRPYWALSQMKTLMWMIREGQIDDNTVIYFDDFWHPGFSALPYACDQEGIRPKIYSMLHAQSFDPHDFTRKMFVWIRPFELGTLEVMSGVFVTSTSLKKLIVDQTIGRKHIGDKIHISGLPYCSEEVRESFPINIPQRKRQVIFSSRWDKEKRPDFFLNVVEETLRIDPSVKFVITTSAKVLRSNRPSLLILLEEYLHRFPHNLELRQNQSKQDYYRNLLESKVQFNCADQDFVSWTLLEATTCGCHPVYPYYLSFPETLNERLDCLYAKGTVQSARNVILSALDVEEEEDFSWVYKRFDDSFTRYLEVMATDEPHADIYYNLKYGNWRNQK